MKRLSIILALFCAHCGNVLAAKSNILPILANDIGHGDVRCYMHKSHVATSHMDGLTREGMPFTDVHSSATVSTQLIPHVAGTSSAAISHQRAGSTTRYRA